VTRDVPADGTGRQNAVERWDFFISYADEDRAWAEWVGWELEAAGYTAMVGAWDFLPGDHRLTRTDAGITGSSGMIALVSRAYLRSEFGQAQWRAALDSDLLGSARGLVPVRVEDCPLPGVRGRTIGVDLFGLDETKARALLLRRIAETIEGRDEPAV
jgi:hypothetical protein